MMFTAGVLWRSDMLLWRLATPGSHFPSAASDLWDVGTMCSCPFNYPGTSLLSRGCEPASRRSRLVNFRKLLPLDVKRVMNF